VSPKRDVTLLARRRVLPPPPSELHYICECYRRQQMTDDNDSERYKSGTPTLCESGPVISVQSNLAEGRIAILSPVTAANPVCRVRWQVDNVQCTHAYVCYNAGTCAPQKCSFPWGIWTSSNTWFLVSTQGSPQRHLGRFSRFRIAHTCDQHTDRHTDHATCDICSNRPQLRTACRIDHN